MGPSVCRLQIRSPEGTNASFANVGFTANRWIVDVLRAPSGKAAAPGLFSECRGQSHRPPCCATADPELFVECCGQSVQSSRVGACCFRPKGHRGARGFSPSLPGSSTSAADVGTPARFQDAQAA